MVDNNGEPQGLPPEYEVVQPETMCDLMWNPYPGRLGPQWFVINRLAETSSGLRPTQGKWVLDYMDDNGEGILFDTASHAESFLFIVLPEKVWRHNNGRVHVGAKPSGRPVDLASLRDKFDLGVASLLF